MGNPVLQPSGASTLLDGLRVDDARMVVMDGRYFLYDKGVQSYETKPSETTMGLAFATDPAGPYVKSHANPVVPGGHEVFASPCVRGVVALIVTSGESGIINTSQYAKDGVAFRWRADLDAVPSGAGAYRPEGFTDSQKKKERRSAGVFT